ncbi:MAG: sigma-70 family RNA polymerase sigma factor [Akkermansiaceae bacterium]|nr:sigma-70 family RNA polymerase sigma factor [Akkermansiaceae bacterium]
MVNASYQSASRPQKRLEKLSDAELVGRCRKELPEELASYRELLRRYEGLVFHTCHKILGNRLDAEEAAQDALTQVFYKIHQFEGRAAFRTWLYRIVRNYCQDRLSKMIREREVKEAYEQHTVNSVPDHEESRQRERVASMVEEALDRLKSSEREIVVLRFISGLTIQEIADVIEVGLSAAKMRLYRALGEFKEAYLRVGKDSPTPLRSNQ